LVAQVQSRTSNMAKLAFASEDLSRQRYCTVFQVISITIF
jgi:hypothetical protein